jgi:uncharacterized membrane protein YqjE
MQATSQRGVDDNAVRDSAAAGQLSLSVALRSLYREASGLLHDHLRLAALEARRAVRNLVLMIGIGLAVALLVITGWAALVATLVALAVEAGASWPAALFGACVVCLAAAGGAALWIRHLASQLMFALTLEWLRPQSSPSPRGTAQEPAA